MFNRVDKFLISCMIFVCFLAGYAIFQDVMYGEEMRSKGCHKVCTDTGGTTMIPIFNGSYTTYIFVPDEDCHWICLDSE